MGVLEGRHVSILRAPAFQNDNTTMIITQMGNIYLVPREVLKARSLRYIPYEPFQKKPTILKLVIVWVI